MEKVNISVIVPSYNSENSIEQCLEGLTSQTAKLTYEIIVVDSSSSDHIANIVKKNPVVKFIKLNQRIYPGIARNIGAKEAKGELLVFIDADVIVSNNCLEDAWDYYKAGHDVFTGSIDIGNKGNSIIERFEWFFEFSEFKPNMKEGVRWCLPSSLLAVRKDVFNNEAFLDMESSEDSEFTVRISKKGNLLYFNPQLYVQHIFNTNPAKALKKAYGFGFSNMRLRQMHNVSGSSIVKIKFFAFFAIPLFAIIKCAEISWRNIRYNNWSDKLLYTVGLPWIAILSLAWMLGFYKGLLSKDSITKR